MAREEPTSAMRQHTKQSGFSTVELLVSLFIAAAFVTIFYQLFVVIDRLASDGYQRSVASNLAYANLRMYATTDSPTWFVCDNSSDLKTYPSGTGQVLLTGTVTADLPPPVTRSVIATAPYGCAATGSGMPVRIESLITYGPQNKKVNHTTYVGY